MPDCCGDYHYSDCPIRTAGYGDSDYDSDYDDYGRDNNWDYPEPRSQDECTHDGASCNDDNIMVCDECEKPLYRLVPCTDPIHETQFDCDNENCFFGKVDVPLS